LLEEKNILPTFFPHYLPSIVPPTCWKEVKQQTRSGQPRVGPAPG